MYSHAIENVENTVKHCKWESTFISLNKLSFTHPKEPAHSLLRTTQIKPHSTTSPDLKLLWKILLQEPHQPPRHPGTFDKDLFSSNLTAVSWLMSLVCISGSTWVFDEEAQAVLCEWMAVDWLVMRGGAAGWTLLGTCTHGFCANEGQRWSALVLSNVTLQVGRWKSFLHHMPITLGS